MGLYGIKRLYRSTLIYKVVSFQSACVSIIILIIILMANLAIAMQLYNIRTNNIIIIRPWQYAQACICVCSKSGLDLDL